MTNNLGYCLAVEKLAGIEVPERGQAIRVIMAELQRLASHCMAIGTFVNDSGAWQTPLMWMFREREKILDLFEMTCGARLTSNYMRIGGVAFEPRGEFEPAVPRDPCGASRSSSTTSRACARERDLPRAHPRRSASCPPDLATNASLSGPMLRGSGIAWDIRKADPYCGYEKYDFDIPVGHQGDSLRPLHRSPRRDAPEREDHQAGARQPTRWPA